MSAISWFETMPSDSSLASLADDELRSMQTSMALGLSESFYWPGSGGGSLASAGDAKLGSLRFARDGTSARTGGFDNGFVLLDSTRVSLHHIGQSGTTMLLGHANMLDRGNLGAAPFGTHWAFSVGSFTTDQGTHTITFGTASAVYSAIPFVKLRSNNSRVLLGISAISTTAFVSIMSHIGSGATPSTVIDFHIEGPITTRAHGAAGFVFA